MHIFKAPLAIGQIDREHLAPPRSWLGVTQRLSRAPWVPRLWDSVREMSAEGAPQTDHHAVHEGACSGRTEKGQQPCQLLAPRCALLEAHPTSNPGPILLMAYSAMARNLIPHFLTSETTLKTLALAMGTALSRCKNENPHPTSRYHLAMVP
jgi:hypothetical protein